MPYHRHLNNRFMLLIPLLLVIAMIAVACGGDDETPTVAPTATTVPDVPTPTVVPTDTPAPTATLRPGETPLPTSTLPPTPTAIPVPMATLVPTVPPRRPTATPTPSGPEPKQGGILNMMIPFGPFGTGFAPYSNGWNPAYLNSPIYNELIHYNPPTPWI